MRLYGLHQTGIRKQIGTERRTFKRVPAESLALFRACRSGWLLPACSLTVRSNRAGGARGPAGSTMWRRREEVGIRQPKPVLASRQMWPTSVCAFRMISFTSSRKLPASSRAIPGQLRAVVSRHVCRKRRRSHHLRGGTGPSRRRQQSECTDRARSAQQVGMACELGVEYKRRCVHVAMRAMRVFVRLAAIELHCVLQVVELLPTKNLERIKDHSTGPLEIESPAAELACQ